MNNNKPTQKDLWKAQILEYLHNCFIGISHLSCSNPDCPLVYNWGEIEKKQSKKGKCAFYKISQDKWVVVDLIKYEENDLGTYENIEIQFKSGKIQRTKPKDYKEPKEKEKKEIFLKDEEIILFFNNSAKRPNLEDAETIYLEDLWETKERIKWDQKASKKKIINWVEQKVDGEDKAYKIDQWENDYIFNIYDPDITNSIKDHEVYSAVNNKEREQLHKDYHEVYSELKEVYGIRHNIQAKEERQNNPEIDMIKAPFLALERDKQRERMKSIKDFENKGGCDGKHILSYGSLGEHQAEVIMEEEMENLENEKSEQSEQKSKENPEILITDARKN
ncbi:MAG: hypothetical protein MRERV_40c011 [Mycoplasmataceae bacterium RV_VA103A]|nr:MAG: hypothetical protein MRERV_40c011 [Mycoplasmataceae bacterium RV_VA103A]